MDSIEFSKRQIAIGEAAHKTTGAPADMLNDYIEMAYYVMGGTRCGDPAQQLALYAARGVNIEAVRHAAHVVGVPSV